MALVAYDLSDSEAEIEQNIDAQSFNNIFSTLPEPKKRVLNIPEEDIEPIPKHKEQSSDASLKKSTKKEPVKISIPALTDYQNDEEDIPKKIIPQSTKATGLFAILPAPKCPPVEKSTKFDPVIVKKNNLIPRSVKVNETKAAAAQPDPDSDDESDKTEHYFSSIFTEEKITTPLLPNLPSSRNIDSAQPVTDSKTNKFFSNLITNAAQQAKESEEVDSPASELDENVYEELCGKRRKKQKPGDIQVVDINAADIMPDAKEWMTKALTEEKPIAAKRGEEPSLQSRRKHQITYLAYQAKMNEQELKNQWAMNRISRKQTQAKYGF